MRRPLAHARHIASPALYEQYARGLDLRFLQNGALPGGGTTVTFTRATTATYLGSDGLLHTAASGAPRFEYDTSGNPLGLLIEDARTNKVTARKHNPTDTSNVTKGGDAASTLTVVDDAAELAAAGLGDICTNGDVYKLDNSAGAAAAAATFGGLTGNTNAHSSSVYVRVTGGTAYLDINGNTAATSSVNTTSASYTRLKLQNWTPTDTSRQLRVDAHAGAVVYIILPQMEEGTFSSSIIPGDALAAVTRSADVATITDLSWFNASEGTFFVEADTADTADTAWAIHLDDGTVNERHTIRLQSAGGNYLVLDGNVAQANIGSLGGALEANTAVKLAAAYKANDFAAAGDGALGTSDTSGTLPSGFTTLRLGGRSGVVGGTDQFLFGHLRRVVYWPVRLPNGVLQKFTV